MKFDLSLSNGRIDTIDVQGCDDLVDLLGVMAKDPEGWISGKVTFQSNKGRVEEHRALIKTSHISSVLEHG